jgi:hypothetical protein
LSAIVPIGVAAREALAGSGLLVLTLLGALMLFNAFGLADRIARQGKDDEQRGYVSSTENFVMRTTGTARLVGAATMVVCGPAAYAFLSGHATASLI